jgi:hypothetical protein
MRVLFYNTTKNANPRSPKERQATHTAVLTGYGDSPSDSLKHTLKKINSTGDVLLKESINAIVRGYDENSENKHTAQHTAD